MYHFMKLFPRASCAGRVWGIGSIAGVVLVLAFLGACDDSKPPLDDRNLPVGNNHQVYLEQGDLPELRQHGKLRVLLPRLSDDVQYLPRAGLPIHYETELVSRFALQNNLEPVWIYVDSFEQLVPMLLAGEGDVIAANFTVTEVRKQTMAFTVPVATVREQLVMRSDDQIIEVGDLVGREIAVQKSTSYWETVQNIVKQYPGIQVRTIPEDVNVEDIIDGVVNRKYDVTVADSNFLAALLPLQDKIVATVNLSGERPIAWAVRANAVTLKAVLDRFLNHEKLITRNRERYHADLPEIKKRKVLRVLTRNNAATYFLWRGELMGFEYELAREFAKRHNLRLEMIVAPTRQKLYSWLREGRGDLIAANLTINEDGAHPGILFSRGYNTVSEVVVTRPDDENLKSVADLNGRTIHVRPGSSYWRSLTKLTGAGQNFKLEAVPENIETEEIIAKVASGEFDLTVADSHILDVELSLYDGDIRAAFELGEPVSHGWAVSESSPKLLAAINAFVKKEYKGLFYNLAHQKYFQKPQAIKKRLQERVDKPGGGSLSPYDELARKYAKQYGFDWRLIVAQMYQESRFDPEAKSWAGARGLLQIMPRTARELGINHISKPEDGIRAGVKYLDWLRERFEPELPVQDRMWFVLASFNAGAGHVKDARRLAKQQGWQSNRWFGHVEKAMLLLSKRKYARKARHGFVRGIEPVNYVREIRNRYEAYVRLTKD